MPERRVPLRPRRLLRNAGLILANGRVTALIVATGLVFGAQLLFLSIAVDVFFDVYGIDTRFPLHFALLASATGLASVLNGSLVTRIGMDRLGRAGFLGLTGSGLLLWISSGLTAGQPALPLFLAVCFAAFFAIGILFGNLNAMAMQSLGKLAGMGSSLIASGSSLVAATFATRSVPCTTETQQHFPSGSPSQGTFR